MSYLKFIQISEEKSSSVRRDSVNIRSIHFPGKESGNCILQARIKYIIKKNGFVKRSCVELVSKREIYAFSKIISNKLSVFFVV